MSTSPDAIALKKRKRDTLPPEGEELEIDVSAPEPPSKKAARRAKKGKPAVSTATADLNDNSDLDDEDTSTKVGRAPKSGVNAETKRSEHGIWIGNLPFSADKPALQTFLIEQAGIDAAMITRIHMPLPTPGNDSRRLKPQNKGFAYVDFDSEAALIAAMGVSEKLLNGRAVLIKNAKNFEGRPDRKAGETGATVAALGGVEKENGATTGNGAPKAKSKRVFVGNLGFDVTKEDLHSHFEQAGEVVDVKMATFEDTGKCKGYAWVDFGNEDASESAVKGYYFKEEEASEDEDIVDDDDDDNKKAKKSKKPKKRKWFINRLFGRALRCEYAEDAQTRYKKRYGKGAREGKGRQDGEAGAGAGGEGQDGADGIVELPKRQRPKGDADQRQEQRRRKHQDARLVKPGAALANAPRASGAMVEGQGKKTTFDE